MRLINCAGTLVLLIVMGCATKAPEKVLSIRGLTQEVPVDLAATQGKGNFRGIERLARTADGKIDANVLLVHGIGWTQGATVQQIGFNFIDALEVAYGVELGGAKAKIARLCPQSSSKYSDASRYFVGGLRILSAEAKQFYTDDPLSPIVSRELACMDRIDISLGAQGVVHLYRLLWDDAFYNSFEYPHLGYDDDSFSEHESLSPGYGGYEHIDRLRLRRTSEYKTSLITYGLSDAAMYIGPAGRLLRDAVRGGLCAAINDATGQTQEFTDIWAQGTMREVQVDRLCDTHGEIRREATLVVMAESLGSRIVFDVLTRMRQETLSDSNRPWDPLLAQKLSQIRGNELEVYLMANQIPLIATGMLSDAPPTAPPNPGGKSLRFIAFSEINDMLTYELVPYFEHLAYLRCWGQAVKPAAFPGCDSVSSSESAKKLVRLLKPSSTLRKQLVQELGFDVVDVRLQFAAPISPFVPDFADPLDAHTGHLKHKVVRELLLCGAEDGEVQRPGCSIQ